MAMDLLSGRATPDPSQGQAPADLASLLGAGGGAASGPVAGGPPDQGGPETTPIDLINQMIGIGQQYLSAEPDEQDKLEMQKVITQLQSLVAKDQQDGDKAMSGDLSARTLRKALG